MRSYCEDFEFFGRVFGLVEVEGGDRFQRFRVDQMKQVRLGHRHQPTVDGKHGNVRIVRWEMLLRVFTSALRKKVITVSGNVSVPFRLRFRPRLNFRLGRG